MKKMKVNNKKIRVTNDDTLAKPNQDLSLLDTQVKKVKRDIKDDDILVVKNLKMYFPISTGLLKTRNLKAVDDVSFSIKRGETLGLVGESGCGKTTLGRTILQLYTPTSGSITFNNHLVSTNRELKNFRKKATVVFQDPYSSLNPRMTVADIIGEPIDVHNICVDIVKQRRFGKLYKIEKELEELKDSLLEHAHEEKKLKELIEKKQNELTHLINTSNKEFIIGQILGEKNRLINDHASTLKREYDDLLFNNRQESKRYQTRINELTIEIKSKEKECEKLKVATTDEAIKKLIINEDKSEHKRKVYKAKIELEKFKINFIDSNPNADVYMSDYKKKQEEYRKLKQVNVVKNIDEKLESRIAQRKKFKVDAYNNALAELESKKKELEGAKEVLASFTIEATNNAKAKFTECEKAANTPKLTTDDIVRQESNEIDIRLKASQEKKVEVEKDLIATKQQLAALVKDNQAKIEILNQELTRQKEVYSKLKNIHVVSVNDIKNQCADQIKNKEEEGKVALKKAADELAEFKNGLKKDKTLRAEYRYKLRAFKLLKDKSSTNSIINAIYNEKNKVLIQGEKDFKAFNRAYKFAMENEYYDLASLLNYEHKRDEYLALKKELSVPYLLLKFEAKEERKKRILQLMADVGLSPEQSSRYAHSFSGGQRQRIGIARALASNPEFIVCDEPVSALDVSIQAQILNTFQELQKKLGLTYLFVAHNLLVVKHISDRIAVMYLGHIVELCESEELYEHPLHPYTISLLSAIPEPDPIRARANKRQILEGEIPSPLHVPSGCPFRLRCPRATDQCADTRPELIEAKKGHFVACHLVKKDK